MRISDWSSDVCSSDLPLVAVDQPFLIKSDEDLADGPVQPLVHREALARPVRRCAEPAELAGDGAAGFGLPVPDAIDEGLAPEIVPALALASEIPLDHHLGGDAGMVGARLPQRVRSEEHTSELQSLMRIS